MVTTTQIRRYAWVVELFLRRKRLTINEINEAWIHSTVADFCGDPINRKTWYKCFEDIAMIYGILIEIDGDKKKSHYAKWTILNPEVLKEKNVEQWMLACVRHRNLLEEFLGMYNRIDIEGFPAENGMLEPVTRAMKENRKIEVIYKRYGYNHAKHYVVEPYFIKSYKQRLYVLCKKDTGLFCTFAFERIIDVNVLKEHFCYPNDLFAEDFFEDAYGVMIPPNKEQPVDIVIRAKEDMRCYLKDVPMHHSQVLIREGKDYTDFMIHIYPTDDFIGAVLQQAERLEILKPASVRNRIKERLEKALKPYLAA